MRKVIFANGEIYHIFNRGVESRPTFINKKECNRAIITLDFYRFENPPLRLARALLLEKEKRADFFLKLRQGGRELVEVLSYVLMPNHFHFLVRQTKKGGISRFVSNFTNSYTRYFNTRHKRIGPLFQGIFKAVRIENEDQLIHVSRYIHINPAVSFLVKDSDLDTYPWSSLPEYLGLVKKGVCKKEIIFARFASLEKYQEFVHDQIDYGKRLEEIKHMVLE